MTPVERVRVGDVLRLERREVEIDPAEEYSLVGVYSFGKGILHREPKRGIELGDYRFFQVAPGDLILSNIQAWEGAIALATERDRGTIGTHRFLSYVPRDGRIDTNWARWFFLSEPGIKLIRRAAPGTAVRNRTLAVKRFEDLVIPLPPIDAQRRVAGLLDRAAHSSSKLASRIRRSCELARATQVSLVTPPGTNDEGDGWVETRIADVVSMSEAQITVEPASEYRIAGAYSFGKGLIDRGVIAGAETSYRTLTRLEAGNIVMSKLNGWEGAVAVVDAGFHHAHVSGEYPTFVVDADRMLPGFFRGIARSPTFWARLDQNVRGSMVRRRRIGAQDFMNTTIWLPSVERQAQISQAIDAVNEIAERSTQSGVRTAVLVPALLNSHFTATA